MVMQNKGGKPLFAFNQRYVGISCYYFTVLYWYYIAGFGYTVSTSKEKSILELIIGIYHKT